MLNSLVFCVVSEHKRRCGRRFLISSPFSHHSTILIVALLNFDEFFQWARCSRIHRVIASC